jgi:hypothetical protein
MRKETKNPIAWIFEKRITKLQCFFVFRKKKDMIEIPNFYT